MALGREEHLLKLRDQLTEVERAISAVLSGAQEYKINNRSIKRADLNSLYAERNRLEKEIQVHECGGGGIFQHAFFEGR